jgi:homoaconitase/3-isopropylmalate dehydratase large subunit
MDERMTVCNMSIEGGGPRGADRTRRYDVQLYPVR